jgi:hypothetical protein
MNCENFHKVICDLSGWWFVLGITLTFVVGFLFDKLIRNIHKRFETYSSPPQGIPKEKWKESVHINEALRKPTCWLGYFEKFLFFIAICGQEFEIIGFWLVFKVASKWEVWHSITKVPQEIYDVKGNKIDELEYLRARNELASLTLQKWLIGTLANIVAAIMGIGIAVLIKKINS